jgi:hypothetical protein
MAKKSNLTALTFRDLVLGAEADVLRQALEARVRIDELIAERQAAYDRIASLETQIEDVIGEPGVFPFPAPPLPVAGLDPKADTFTRSSGASAAVKKPPVREPAAPPPSEADDDNDESSDEEAPADEESDV